MDNELLEPLSAYEKVYKAKFLHNAIKYFDELTEKGKVDSELNKQTIEKIKKADEDISSLQKALNKKNILMVFLYIMLVAFLIFTFFCWTAYLYTLIVVPILCSIFFIGYLVSMILIKKRIVDKKIDNLENELREKIVSKEMLIQDAKEQMSGLNSLYDWNTTSKIICDTIDLIKMDKHFDAKKYNYLREKYGFGISDSTDESICFVQSGSILGNPFLICKSHDMRMRRMVYEGELDIHWRTQIRTRDGYQTIYHSQTLRASVAADYPTYDYNTYLVYGNDAAPNLRFSRFPKVNINDTDNEINRYVKKEIKSLQRKEKREVMNTSSGNTFTRLGNDEFEALFGGTDRNNEVEYRLLMTPLAQKNLLSLIKSKKPYGDDFAFIKDYEMNYIRSHHSQYIDYRNDPTQFIDYNYEEARKRFIEYSCKYFEGFYFDLAPLLSIPLYQQHKSLDYIYKNECEENVSPYEHEVIANAFNPKLLRHRYADTENIFKTKFLSSSGNVDKVRVTAHSYRRMRRVTYVTKYGGDGRYHKVPVYWYEFIPVAKETDIIVEKNDLSRYDYNNLSLTRKFSSIISKYSKKRNYRFERGLFGAILRSELMIDGSEIDEVFHGSLDSDSLDSMGKMLSVLDEELEREDDSTDLSESREEEAEEVAEESAEVVDTDDGEIE